MTTEAEREAAFQRRLQSTVNYFAAVEANGDTPWFGSVEERRELFLRRYERPAAKGAPPRSRAEINRKANAA